MDDIQYIRRDFPCGSVINVATTTCAACGQKVKVQIVARKTRCRCEIEPHLILSGSCVASGDEISGVEVRVYFIKNSDHVRVEGFRRLS